ncbi:MAG: hypothetical protein HKN03_10810 [Acidimicrobiales bacterium]|nr:hypothetical protein [Acidimicrobiales bacterium]
MPIHENMEAVTIEHSELIQRVAEMRAAINGQLSDKGRIVDHLLDIRLDFEAAGIVAIIDELLVEMPGLTVVENSWWTTALDRLQLAASPTAV